MNYLERVFPGFWLIATLVCNAEPEGSTLLRPGEGARVRLQVERFTAKTDKPRKNKLIEVFVDRPHLLGGASFLLLAPEHGMLQDLTAPVLWDQVKTYAEQVRKKSLVERTDPARKGSSMFLGSYAVNPLTGWRMPIWVSDHVAKEYPLEAWLGIPAHDPWQFTFARQHGIEVVPAIRLKAEGAEPAGVSLRQAYTGAGKLVDSGELTGLETTGARGREDPAFAAAIKWLERHGQGDVAKGRDYAIWAQHRWNAARENAIAGSNAGSSQDKARVWAASRIGPDGQVKLNRMVDHTWLFSKPRTASTVPP